MSRRDVDRDEMFYPRGPGTTRGTVAAMRMLWSLANLGAIAGAIGACSTPTSNVNGTYDLTLTQGSDACHVGTAGEGGVTTGSTLTIETRMDRHQGLIPRTLGGTNASMLMTLVGNTTFTGTIDGDGIQMTISGEFTRMIDTCNYNLDSVITATASSDGKTLFGALDYLEVSSDAECTITNDAGSAITGAIACTTPLSLSGTRE